MRRPTGWANLALALLLLTAAGCAHHRTAANNPTYVPEPPGGYEHVWNTTVRVVGKYFDIATEDRYDGAIETKPQTGATVLEPWRRDTVGLRNRLESSLQTIRRRASVRLQPASGGGYTVAVKVFKELEDLPKPIFSQVGGGTLLHSIMPIREQVYDQESPPTRGWISQGEDELLEAVIVHDLQRELGGIADPDNMCAPAPATGAIALPTAPMEGLPTAPTIALPPAQPVAPATPQPPPANPS